MSVETPKLSTSDFQSESVNEKTLMTQLYSEQSGKSSPRAHESTSSDSGPASDSDAGYSTPAENFADDEEHRNDGAASVNPAPLPAANSATSSSSIKSSNAVEVVVDPELQERIVKQVEWYFSDENLLKDSFLMKHINRNKQGYVSLKLVASLRKVKALTKDWQAVLLSMRHSSSLALNEEATKIRRITAAPKVDYSHVSRTVIITNYPESEPTVHDIEKQFGRFGDVTLVRMLHPGRAIPLDVKPRKEQFPSLGKELCILIEYESEEGAKVAFRKFNDQQSWRDEMKVNLLGEKKSSPETTATTKEEKKEDSKTPSELSTTAAGSADGKKKRKKSNQKTTTTTSSSSQQHQLKGRYSREKSPGRFSNSNTPSPRQSRDSSPAPHRKYTPPSSSVSPDVHRKRSAGAKYSPELVRRTRLHPDACKDYTSDSGFSTGSRSSSESPKSTPEPLKRFFSGDLAPSWRTSEKHVHVKDSCVLRQPHGPDGTKGFHRRPVCISVEAC